MKYTLTFVAAAAAIATTFGIELAKKPTPEPTPQPQIVEPKLYTTTFRIEATCPASTAVALANVVNSEEGAAAVHCVDCHMGVYAPNEDGKEACSYCSKLRNKE